MCSAAIGRENCNEGKIRERTNTAYSDYNGLQAEFRTTNLFHQLTMKTNYTWSKTTDNASEIFGTFAGANTVAFSQDPLNYTRRSMGFRAWISHRPGRFRSTRISRSLSQQKGIDRARA